MTWIVFSGIVLLPSAACRLKTNQDGCYDQDGKLCSLKISNLDRCDDHDGSKCLQLQKPEVTYSFSVPAEKSGTWRKLSYYMYFHSRETPGIRADFNRSLTEQEAKALQESLICSYRAEKGKFFITGELEGRRIDENARGFWCFDYLGTMLLEYHKKYKTAENRPDPGFFPLKLVLTFKSALPAVNGQITSHITVRWTVPKGKI